MKLIEKERERGRIKRENVREKGKTAMQTRERGPGKKDGER